MLADGVLNNKKVVVTSDRKNYWRYYGLRFDPFAALPKESLGYLTANREQQFDILHYLCRSNNVLITILGNKGIGKSMLIKQFVAQTDDSIVIQQLLGSKHLGLSQLIEAIENGFSVASANEENVEDRLDNLLTQLQEQKKLSLLVIDDAHLLPADTLKALMYFVKQQSESQMQLHVILLGQPTLKENLNQLCESALDQELIHNIDLLPLTLDETQGYIKHRLHNAGLPAAIPLSHYAITRIHKLSQGIPERVNVIAKQYLVEAMQQKQLNSISTFMENHRTEVIGGSIIFVILVTIATLWSHGSHYPVIPSWSIFSNDHMKSYNTPTATNEDVSTTTTNNSVNHSNNPGITSAAELPRIDGSGYNFTIPGAHPASVPASMSFKSAPLAPTEVKQQFINSTAATPTTNVVKSTVLNSVNAKPKMFSSTSKAPTANVVISPPVHTAVASPKAISSSAIVPAANDAIPASLSSAKLTVVPFTQATAAVIKSTPSNTVTQPHSVIASVNATSASSQTDEGRNPFSPVNINLTNQKAAVNNKQIANTLNTVQANIIEDGQMPVSHTAPVTPHTVSQAANNKTEDEQGLLALDSGRYMLQLIGVSNQTALKHFIEVNQLGSQAKYFHSTLNGKDWYVLLYGNFENKAEANAAIHGLPMAVQSQHPWVRAVSSVQSSIRKQQMMLGSNANSKE